MRMFLVVNLVITVVMMISALVCFTCAGARISEEDRKSILHTTSRGSPSGVVNALLRPGVNKWIKRGLLLCGMSVLCILILGFVLLLLANFGSKGGSKDGQVAIKLGTEWGLRVGFWRGLSPSDIGVVGAFPCGSFDGDSPCEIYHGPRGNPLRGTRKTV